MKILFLMKRYGSGKDLLISQFGRQIEIAKQLVSLGHTVDFFCVDFKRGKKVSFRKNNMGFVSVGSFQLPRFIVPKVLSYIKKKQYNLIVGSTSPILGVVADRVSRQTGIPFVYDLQDNFEFYDECKLPLMKRNHRLAVKHADLIWVVSKTLERKLFSKKKKKVLVVPNGYDPTLFKQISTKTARKKIGIAPKSQLIAYIGHVSPVKGLDVLLKAFSELHKDNARAQLLLSGPVDKGFSIKKPGVIYESLSRRSDVVAALCAADVAVIPNVDNSFTRYCFPYKLAEYMASGVKIVATDIGDVGSVLKPYPHSLARVGSISSMKDKIQKQLNAKKPSYVRRLKTLTWRAIVKKIDTHFTQCLN